MNLQRPGTDMSLTIYANPCQRVYDPQLAVNVDSTAIVAICWTYGMPCLSVE
jgi:hypothetical protein